MKIRLALIFAAAPLLCACTDTDWSHGMSFIGLDDSAGNAAQSASDAAPQPVAQNMPRPVTQAAAASAPAQTAQAGVNPFCAAVARQDADGHGFDAQTQQGMFVRSYQQCVTVFGNVPD